MPTISATTSAFPTEKQLRRLLVSRDPADAGMLQALLDKPPAGDPEAITSLLTHIAKNAQSNIERLKWESKMTLICVPLVIVYVTMILRGPKELLTVGQLALGYPLSQIIMSVFLAPGRVRGARNALILLAKINDIRAPEYLAKVWTPCPLTQHEAAFNNDVSHELTRLLVERDGKRFDRATERALRNLVGKALPAGRLRQATRRFRAVRDLTETDMDLLLAVVRHVSHSYIRRSTHTSEPNADNATLQQVAALSAPGANYDLLRDTTQALLKQRGTGNS